MDVVVVHEVAASIDGFFVLARKGLTALGAGVDADSQLRRA